MKKTDILQQKDGKMFFVTNVRFADITKQKCYDLGLPAGASQYKINQKIKQLKRVIKTEQQNTFGESMFIEKYQNSTLDEFVKIYLEHKKSKVQQVTYDNYFGDSKIITEYFSKFDLPLKQINLTHVQGFLSYLTNKNLSATSVNRYTNLLGDIFNHAVFLGVLKKNVVKQVERPKIKKFEYGFYSAKQIKKLFDRLQSENSIYALPIILTATYGLRCRDRKSVV